MENHICSLGQKDFYIPGHSTASKWRSHIYKSDIDEDVPVSGMLCKSSLHVSLCLYQFIIKLLHIVATLSKNFKINLEGQNYVHFCVILSRNVKNIWYNGITIAEW